jgi:hypothetical protein
MNFDPLTRSSIVRAFSLALALFFGTSAHAQAWLDKVDDALFLESPGKVYRVDLSGLLDLEGYYVDQRPPGLLFGDGDSFFNPRLSLFLDAHAGPHLYSFVQARFDRGFQPRAPEANARFDEYLLRYTPFDDSRLNLQAGKFATVVGNWVLRHHSWDNPFINAPLPYENVTIVSDLNPVPTPAAFLARRDTPDKKEIWLPIVWGPDYASGASVFGSLGQWDYAAEVKNASLSSRSVSWDGRDVGWEDPTVSARLGFRPGAAWNLGVSFSYGAYLRPEAEDNPAFPAGRNRGDFNQITFAQDASFEWHHWQFWGEVFLSRFQVPNVGDADTLAYYLEAKYKITTRLFAAVRWNQQFFDTISDGAGGQAAWDRDIWRVDSAIGYRLTRHLQGKIQYSFSDQRGSLQQGQQLVAAQATLKF